MKNIFDEDAYLTIVNLSLRKHYKTIMRRRKKLEKKWKILQTKLQSNTRYNVCIWHTIYAIMWLYLN